MSCFRKYEIPVTIASATSVLVTFCIVVIAVSTSLIVKLILNEAAVPLQLIVWTVPGVLIGGQIGPYFAKKYFTSDKKDVGLIITFIIISMLMFAETYVKFKAQNYEVLWWICASD